MAATGDLPWLARTPKHQDWHAKKCLADTPAFKAQSSLVLDSCLSLAGSPGPVRTGTLPPAASAAGSSATGTRWGGSSTLRSPPPPFRCPGPGYLHSTPTPGPYGPCGRPLASMAGLPLALVSPYTGPLAGTSVSPPSFHHSGLPCHCGRSLDDWDHSILLSTVSFGLVILI